MADHLTSLQDSLEQLATQMFASLRYISAHHSLAPISDQPFHGEPEPRASRAPNSNHPTHLGAQSEEHVVQQLQDYSQDQDQDRDQSLNDTQNQVQTQTQTQTHTRAQSRDEEFDPDEPSRPDTPETFAAALEELAQDLVTKEQQIEWLIGSLPGRGRSKEEQEERLRELDAELRGVEGEVEEARQEGEALTRYVEEAMMSVKRW